MHESQGFRIGDERSVELILERVSAVGDGLSFVLVCYNCGIAVCPATVPLGDFLRSLGFTAEDCAAALKGPTGFEADGQSTDPESPPPPE